MVITHMILCFYPFTATPQVTAYISDICKADCFIGEPSILWQNSDP